MSLKNWNELPLLVKRNPKKFFDYLSEELGLSTSWDDLTVIERRSRHKQYKIIQESVDGLPAWNELSPFERRNLKKLYKKIQIMADGNAQPQRLNASRLTSSKPNVMESAEPANFNVGVSVKDSEGNNVQGATVTLTDVSDSTRIFRGTSGKAGGCTIKPVAGEYIVTAAAEEYSDYSSEDNLVVEDNTSLTIVLTK